MPEPYIEKPPFPVKIKEHSIIASVVNKNAKKALEPAEQIEVEPTIAIVKDVVTENVEGGHIIFREDASILFHILVELRKQVLLCFQSR